MISFFFFAKGDFQSEVANAAKIPQPTMSDNLTDVTAETSHLAAPCCFRSIFVCFNDDI